MGKSLGKLGEFFEKIRGKDFCRFFGVGGIFGTAVMARRTGGGTAACAGFPVWWLTAVLG
jgi:hypothetical protein